jgi:hypothetical protein
VGLSPFDLGVGDSSQHCVLATVSAPRLAGCDSPQDRRVEPDFEEEAGTESSLESRLGRPQVRAAPVGGRHLWVNGKTVMRVDVPADRCQPSPFSTMEPVPVLARGKVSGQRADVERKNRARGNPRTRP